MGWRVSSQTAKGVRPARTIVAVGLAIAAVFLFFAYNATRDAVGIVVFGLLVIVFGTVWYLIRSGREAHAFVTSESKTMIHPSVADIPEDSLVQLLLSDRYWRSVLLGIRGIPDNALDFQRVPLSSAPGGFEGDVDVLLCAESQPHAAIAIEVKRVKIGASAFRSEQPNKLQEFEKGIRQANLLARVGFSQVYLFVLVVVDSREQNDGRISYDGPTSKLRNLIHRTITTRNLVQRVGLMHHEFVQPMDRAPLGVGSHGAHLERIAETVVQPDALTSWVAEIIEKRAA